MKLLQVAWAQRPCGVLGFEAGVYRFHYSSGASNPGIHPLMPGSRVFYESPQLFPVFEQCLPLGYSQAQGGHAALKALETMGQAHWLPMAFANPDSPRLVPRYMVNMPELLQASQALAVWQRWAQTLGAHALLPGPCPTLRVHARHGKPNNPRADYCLLAMRDGDVQPTSLANTAKRLALAQQAGVWCPPAQWSACGQVLALHVGDMPHTVHQLAGLCGLNPAQAAQLGAAQQWVLARRVLGVFGGQNSVQTLSRLQGLLHSSGQIKTNPLLGLGLAQNRLVFMP